MDSLLFLRDTITVNVVKIIDSAQPCVQSAESNNNGLWIALIICLSIVAITLIIGATIIRCKKAALASKAEMEQIRNDNEEKKRNDDRERQKTAGELKKEKQIPSKEESFVDFCQNDVLIKEKLIDICAQYYKEVMAKELNIDTTKEQDSGNNPELDT